MSFHDHDYPWLFHRDEVDLLEDDLEDLYAAYGNDSGEEPMSEEAEILQEQMDTEEQSDAQLTLTLGMGILHDAHGAPQSSPELSSHEQQDDACVMSIRRHPLYQRSFTWAADLRKFANERYERSGPYRLAFFRVVANVNLVPIKIFTALAEEMHDDPIGLCVAEEAYLLALTYLERIRESLSSVLHTVEEFETMKRIQTQGEVLKAALAQHLAALRRRKNML